MKNLLDRYSLKNLIIDAVNALSKLFFSFIKTDNLIKPIPIMSKEPPILIKDRSIELIF